jgi:HAD superfamily hydrolase (TIGR01509 family)
MLHDMDNHADAPDDPAERAALAAVLHRRKNEAYADIVGMGRIVPRPGVLRLMDEAAAAGMRQGIATTTSRTNVDALLGGWFGRTWRDRYAAVVCGEDVAIKKPDPEVYRRTLEQLGLSADRVLAFEDSGPGLRSASAAGLAVVLAPSVYFADSCADAVADCVTPVWQVKDLDHPLAMSLAALRAWFDTGCKVIPTAG